MNREETINQVKDIQSKIYELIEQIDRKFVVEKLLNTIIWLNRFKDSFNKPFDEKIDNLEELANMEDIHNDKAKLDYQVKYLDGLVNKLLRYGVNVNKPEEQHALLKAIDYLYEAIGFLQ